MARITKSDNAPAEAKHFSLANVEFDLKAKNSVYETDDAAVIANARAHPYLAVEEDVQAPDATVTASDPLDPHENPSADHLSTAATPAAVAAADANEAAIREATGLSDAFGAPADSPEPTVAETLGATFDVAAPDAEPVFPADAEQSAQAPPADAPGGGTTEPPADADTTDDTTTDAPGKDS